MFRYILFLICLAVGTAINAGSIISLKSGRYQVDISRNNAYTMNGFKYDGVEFAVPGGAYNFTLEVAPSKSIGSAFTEGGEEKIESISIEADGRKMPLDQMEPVAGKKIIMKKVSLLDNLKLYTEITVSSDGIRENKYFETVADQDVHAINLYLYNWNSKSSGWAAGLSNGKTDSGLFGEKFDGKTCWHLEEDVEWYAVEDQSKSKGMLVYFPEEIKGENTKSSFMEVKDRYIKYSLVLNSPNEYKEGFRSPDYEAIIKGFPVKTDKFVDEADKTAESVKQELAALNKTDNKKKKMPGGYVTFAGNFGPDSKNADAVAAVGNEKAELPEKGEVAFSRKDKKITGMLIGEGCVSPVYDTEGNIPEGEGAIELLVKPGNYDWNDDKIHTFLRIAGDKEKTSQLYIYKYKKSGLSVYFVPNGTGKKLFLNFAGKDWKDRNWHHLVFTWSSRYLTLYVDGEEKEKVYLESEIKWPNKFNLGPGPDNFGNEGRTEVAAVFVYKRALRSYEVEGVAKDRLPDLPNGNTWHAGKMLGGDKKLHLKRSLKDK